MKTRFAVAGFAVAQLSFGAPAYAQNVSVTLAPEEIVAVVRSMDRQQSAAAPPAGFWNAQAKILAALKADPDAWRKVRAALDQHYSVR